MNQADCKHLNFGTVAEIHRHIKSETDDTVLGVVAKFAIHCTECGKHFEFTSPREAARSLDREQLSIVIKPASGLATEFRTRVHIADKPEDGRQKCFRCDTVLAESGGAWMAPEGQHVSRNPFWAVGKYVGIVERADDDPVNPKALSLMEHDAQGADQIICTTPL
jgi:hypothetical protein